MEPLRPGYRRRETRKQDQTLLVIATIIAAPVVMLLFLFALSRTNPGAPATDPQRAPATTAVRQAPVIATPTPGMARQAQQQTASPFRETGQVEFYTHPAPVPTLTNQQRYERASEIYRSMGSGSRPPTRPTPRPTARPAAASQSQCKWLAQRKAYIESIMRTGYSASASRGLHAELNDIVKRMQRLHCLR